MARDLGKATYESLNSIAYERIVQGLRDGKFEQGENLVTRELARSLGISSTPVREALTRLIEQNALDVTPTSRAAVVPHITRDLLDELYEVRLILDGLAARAAANNITDQEVSALKVIATNLKTLEKEGETPEFLELSQNFFSKVFQSARKPILSKLIDNLWLRSSVILGLLSKKRPKSFSIAKHRDALVGALARRDQEGANEAMNNILVTTRDMVFGLLDSAQRDDAPPKSKRRTRLSKSG